MSIDVKDISEAAVGAHRAPPTRTMWDAMQAASTSSPRCGRPPERGHASRTYLVYECRFRQRPTMLIFGHMLVKAPGLEERRWLAESCRRWRSASRSGYFERTFAALGHHRGRPRPPLAAVGVRLPGTAYSPSPATAPIATASPSCWRPNGCTPPGAPAPPHAGSAIPSSGAGSTCSRTRIPGAGRLAAPPARRRRSSRGRSSR